MTRRILLINPWITDVAAYDLWAWPLGLLYWASWLREWDFEVALIDCMDRFHPALEGRKRPVSRQFNTGKYHTQPFEFQPEPARQAKRLFRRHGLPPDQFEEQLHLLQDSNSSFGGKPDAILVTSRMTYWYHGVIDAIARCRRKWPNVPTILGGTYATLCPDHAKRHSGADHVFAGSGHGELTHWLKDRFPEKIHLIRTPDSAPDAWPRPAFDLCHGHASLPLLTSIGCPFHCSYCASKKLVPHFARRSPESVFAEVADHYHRWGTTDFAFYDDALLVASEEFFECFLDRIINSGINARFHTPNGLHYWMIHEQLAKKMHQARVETIRLSLESSVASRLSSWNRKAGGIDAFCASVTHLRQAGFASSQIGVYVMAGMPGQTVEEVERTLALIKHAGATPKINEYSPISGTAEWDKAVEMSGPEIGEEPLWQNNNLYYTRPELAFTHEDFVHLRKAAKDWE